MFREVAPILPVCDLDAALERFRRLGFDVEPYAGGPRYGFAHRDGTQVHFTESPEHDPKRTASALYLYVDDADAVCAEWKAAGVEGRFGEPFDAEWGLREFTYVDPDGHLLRVGSPLPR